MYMHIFVILMCLLCLAEYNLMKNTLPFHEDELKSYQMDVTSYREMRYTCVRSFNGLCAIV